MIVAKEKSYVMNLNLDEQIKRIGIKHRSDSPFCSSWKRTISLLQYFHFIMQYQVVGKGESTGLGFWLHGGKNNFKSFNRRNYSPI